MGYLEQIPNDVLALIIQRVPKGSRVNLLQTCRRVLQIALTKVWKPHTHGGNALIQACKVNNLEYYIKWTTAPGTFASKTVRYKAFEAALEGKAIETAMWFAKSVSNNNLVTSFPNCLKMGKILLCTNREEMTKFVPFFYGIGKNYE